MHKRLLAKGTTNSSGQSKQRFHAGEEKRAWFLLTGSKLVVDLQG
jgi:hypothetical protein